MPSYLEMESILKWHLIRPTNVTFYYNTTIRATHLYF